MCCGKFKIISKTSEGPKIKPEDLFTFNESFTKVQKKFIIPTV